MNNKLLLCVAIMCTVSFAHASELDVPTGNISQKPSTLSTLSTLNRSIAFVGSSQANQSRDTLFLVPADSQSVGVLVDYKPFDRSGFNMSAASVTHQTNSLQTLPYVNRAYLGVGWKSLLDEAKTLGVRVDIGAIYDDYSDQINAPTSGAQAGTSKNLTPSEWNPVISLGVSYRF